MSTTVNLTDKLGMAGRPKIEIGDVTLTVDTRAETMLKLMELLGDGEEFNPQDVFAAARILFDEDDYAELSAMELDFTDFNTVIATAMDLIAGGAAEGEAETLATT